MGRNKYKAVSLIGIFLLLYNVIMLVIPVNKGVSFWITYTASNIAIIAQLVVWYFTQKDGKELKHKFFSIPMIRISFIYLIIQILLSIICMIFTDIPYWFTIILNITFLSVSATILICASIAKKTLEVFEDKMLTKCSYIPKIRIDINSIARKEKNEEIKSALEDLSEKIRYSDPVSSDVLHNIENDILANINKLKTAEEKAHLIEEISSLIEERNELCKMMK